MDCAPPHLTFMVAILVFIMVCIFVPKEDWGVMARVVLDVRMLGVRGGVWGMGEVCVHVGGRS